MILVLATIIVLAVDAKTPKDLIIHLPFEEEGGKMAKDVSPNKFVGEVKNAKWVEGVQGKASLGTYQSNPALNRYALDGKLDEVRLSLRIKTKQEIGESMRGFAIQPSHKLAISWGRINRGGLGETWERLICHRATYADYLHC